MKAVWTPEAADDLEQLLIFLSERSPTAAASVAARIDHGLKTISEFPSAGRLDQDMDVREWIVPGLPLLIIYQTSAVLIEIIALFHTSRDPDTKRQPH